MFDEVEELIAKDKNSQETGRGEKSQQTEPNSNNPDKNNKNNKDIYDSIDGLFSTTNWEISQD